MTAHELANYLLKGPNIKIGVVVQEDGKEVIIPAKAATTLYPADLNAFKSMVLIHCELEPEKQNDED